MEVRDALLQDLPRIVEIYNSTVQSRMVTADTEPVSVESRVSWFHQHVPGSRPLWMVVEQNEVIGWVAIHSFYGRPAYQATAEISIYLDESFRGKGLGKKVLSKTEAACKDIGIKNLIGYIFAHNIPSVNLFLRSGFSEWGHLPNIAVIDGVQRSVKIFGKSIDYHHEKDSLV